MKCACDGPLICLECRAEIARRVAGEGGGWTWTIAGIKAMWAATDAAKKRRAAVAVVATADEDDSFGWSPT